MIGRFLKAVFILGVLGVLSTYAAFRFFSHWSYGEAEVAYRLNRGVSSHQVALDLERLGVIPNAVLFQIYVKVLHAGAAIRAGDYVFPPQQTPEQILNLLQNGDFKASRVTIPEGWTIRQIGEIFEKEGFTVANRFEARCHDPVFIQKLSVTFPFLEGVTTLEGYLFPDTYEFYQPTTPTIDDEIIEKMVRRFKENYTPEMELQEKASGLTSYQVVILASIIEKETSRGEERSLVSSVMVNRLKQGIPLATDPSVIYGIPNYDGNIRRSDLERPGPYNTYLNPGLPPTPIANPGLASLKAALFPAETKYLYFVSKNDGSHHFSETYNEHVNAVNKFQRGR